MSNVLPMRQSFEPSLASSSDGGDLTTSFLAPPLAAFSGRRPVTDERPISSIQSENAAGSIFDLYTSDDAALDLDLTPTGTFPPASHGDHRQPQKAASCADLSDVVVGDLTLHPPTDSNRSSSAATFSDGGGSHGSLSVRSSLPPPGESSAATPARGASLPPPNHRPGTLQVERVNQLNVSQATSVASTGSHQAEGEEEDSFLVRSTYARLDVTGVTGDGWEDGVERTRERSKLGRRSMLFPHSSSADGLDERERDMRSNLDRYGFFPSALSQRSESRIFAIPPSNLAVPTSLAPPTSRRSSLPSSSRSASPVPSSAATSPRLSESSKAKEVARIAKWDRMLVRQKKDAGGNVVSWAWAPGKSEKISPRVYKGIPDRWRASAWDTLADSFAKANSDRKGKQRASTTDELLSEYAERIDRPSSFDVQIDLDVPRTVSGHVLFHTRYGLGQRALFHCLHVFSLRCDDCQYCQGMGSIAANLLCYFSAEKTYVLLVRLHDHYGMHEIFSPGFPGMLEAFYVQERLIESMMPDVFTTLKREMVSTSSFATKWYITLFSTTLPFQTQLRVWDAFLLEGPDLMIVVSLAIVWSFRENLSAADANFETILSLLSSFFVPGDDDAFMRWIQSTLALKGLRTKIGGWRREWQELLAQGKAMDTLI